MSFLKNWAFDGGQEDPPDAGLVAFESGLLHRMDMLLEDAPGPQPFGQSFVDRLLREAFKGSPGPASTLHPEPNCKSCKGTK